MDSLSVYFNAMWQEAQRPLPRTERPNTRADIAAFVRRLQSAPRLVYSAIAERWLLRSDQR